MHHYNGFFPVVASPLPYQLLGSWESPGKITDTQVFPAQGLALGTAPLTTILAVLWRMNQRVSKMEARQPFRGPLQ